MSAHELEQSVATLTDAEARRLHRLLEERLKSVGDPAEPLSEGEKLYDRIEHLVGCVEDGPEDLSANKEYLSGMGDRSLP
jgi:hypothetical protein